MIAELFGILGTAIAATPEQAEEGAYGYVEESTLSEAEVDDSELNAPTGFEDDSEETSSIGEQSPISTIDDVPEDLRPVVERKLKDLERGYTKKFQTLSEERRALELKEAQLAEREKVLEQIAARYQPQVGEPVVENPWEEIDWDLVDPAVKFLAEQLIQVQQNQAMLGRDIYGNVLPTVQEQIKEKQMMSLRQKYGDLFDEALFEETMRKYPGSDPELVALAAFGDKLAERRAQQIAKSAALKRQATPVDSSGVKTINEPDTSRWSLRDFYRHAREKGTRLR